MKGELDIRVATPADIAIIARHRARVLLEMGVLSAVLVPDLERATADYLAAALPAGEYLGWLTTVGGHEVVAGAGVQLRRVLAFPGTDGARVAKDRQALVLNVYTEPPWRRRGIARALMQRIIEWARAEQVDGLVLHAAPDGRVLYEELGFVATNEMRYTGTLAPATPGPGPAG